ncbi:uncharacterized protein V6R79_019828 [Siganus canaliculatus]
MPAVESFTMTYNALNQYGTFSEGDCLTGKVTLVLSKETTVDSLFVKVKGDADVRWTKRMNDRTYTYTSHKRYFKQKQFLIPENETVIPRGSHVYEFRLQIPTGGMPSSFRGTHGKIVYKLEAKLSRSWRIDRTVEKELHFVSKSILNQPLMSRQVGSTNKGMGFFSKGKVHMDAIVDRTGYAAGETVAIGAKINNSSSSEMTPKFSLVRDVVFYAQGSTKHEESVLHKMVDQCIPPRTEKTIKCAFKIPRDVIQTINNCDIITVTYHLKVYLDISFSFDPKVVFPLLIIHPAFAPGLQTGRNIGPHSTNAAGGQSNSDFPSPSMAWRSYPASPAGVPVGPCPPGAFGSPSHSDFPPPSTMRSPYSASPAGVAVGPCPPGAFGGPSTSNFPAPPAAMGLNAFPSGSYGYSDYSAPPPAYPGYDPVPQQAYPYGDTSTSSSTVHPPPSAPSFHPPPSAPHVPQSPSHANPTAPACSLLPSAPMMDTDFLSQTDEPPPEYSLLFPSSVENNSDAK